MAILAWTLPASATNGLNLIGFGAGSVGMGGADLAVARDTTAMNTNPSGLTQIRDRRLDLYAAATYAIDVRHRDGVGNDRMVATKLIPLGDFGYAQRLESLPVTLGIGLFGQGGSGLEYKDLATTFGTTDDLTIQFRIARVTPTVAWRVNDRLSLGLAALITYSDANEEFFPNTSFVDPADSSNAFFGFEVKDLDTLATGFKVGAMWRVNNAITVGAAYTSQVDLDLAGGEMVMEMSAAGLGKVTYHDVEVTGVNQPREIGAGIAWQANHALLISAELNWIDWSAAVKCSSLRASDPDVSGAPTTVALDVDLDWRDQYVVALGTAYDVSNATVLRAGYNYGRSPVRARHLHPLLAFTAQHHLTTGVGHRFNEWWRADAAVDYQFREKTTYTNPDLPFGTDAEEVVETVEVHLMVSRRW